MTAATGAQERDSGRMISDEERPQRGGKEGVPAPLGLGGALVKDHT